MWNGNGIPQLYIAVYDIDFLCCIVMMLSIHVYIYVYIFASNDVKRKKICKILRSFYPVVWT